MPPKFEYERVKAPSGLRDLPRYLKALLGGFFSRIFYIFKLVCKTGPWILFSMLFLAILNGILPIVGSLISQRVLNALQENFGLFDAGIGAFIGSSVFFLLIFMFAHRLLSGIVSTFNSSMLRVAGESVVRTVKLEIMNKAKELDISCFDMPAFYEKLENANREAGNRPVQILYSTFNIVSGLISLVSYIIVLASELWWAAIVMALVSVPSAIISFHYRKKNFWYMRRRSKDRRQMAYYSDIMVNKDLAKEIRMFDLSDTFIQRYETVFDKYFAGIKKLVWRENAWHFAITVLSCAANFLFFGYFAYAVITGGMMIGDYSLYTGALAQITSNVSLIITTSASIYEGTLFIDNLISFLKVKKTVAPLCELEREEKGCKTSDEQPLKVAHGQPHTIVFENVSFAYPGTDRRVLDGINLTVRPGETLVLVGLNGAGKTTLLKLLTRLYDPTEGRILLDGHDLREYDVQDLYRMFGIIFQDFGKYAESVSENIRFGDIYREADEAAIEKAAAESDAADYISRLPDGYDTPLMRVFEDNGIELSIGQWQKLAIARAFYSESDVLILDEPTASLDALAEQEIFEQFDRLRADKTTIFVSHRLSSATVASKIAVLEYGRLIEEGTHKELMDKGGRYCELFSTQAKRYIAEAEN